MTVAVAEYRVYGKKNEIVLMRQNYFKCMNLSAKIIT